MKRALPSDSYKDYSQFKEHKLSSRAAHLQSQRFADHMHTRAEPMEVEAPPCPSPMCTGKVRQVGNVKVCSMCSVQFSSLSDLEASFYFHSSSGCTLTPRFKKNPLFAELTCSCGFIEFLDSST
mmetsp:Transcript_8117/g.15980  ORF Transcript_8117/g.15980 Transcript_8117/m.15980 type:complete len:124 (-) Transcript_8117:3515-3886(-)